MKLRRKILPAFMASLRNGESGFVGGNVTIPHKEMAFALADRPDELSTELGAVNTLWREDGSGACDQYGWAWLHCQSR